jgi:hypothetical protein
MLVFWEDLFAASIFAAVPIWLVLRAWRRYQAVSWTTNKEVFLGRSVLALLILSLVVIVVGGVVAVVEEHLGVMRTIDQIAPAPWKIAIVNVSICAGALLIASQMPKGNRDVVRARRSMVAAGMYLAIAWLLIMSSPH